MIDRSSPTIGSCRLAGCLRPRRPLLGGVSNCITSSCHYSQSLVSLCPAFRPACSTMRPVKACLQCRSGKRRCDRTGDLACSQCIQRNLPCSAAINSLQSAQSLPPVVSTRSSEETIHLVDLYFRFIHDQPHSLFHQPSFKASVVAGTASPPVLLSMMGMAARYIRTPWPALAHII